MKKSNLNQEVEVLKARLQELATEYNALKAAQTTGVGDKSLADFQSAQKLIQPFAAKIVAAAKGEAVEFSADEQATLGKVNVLASAFLKAYAGFSGSQQASSEKLAANAKAIIKVAKLRPQSATRQASSNNDTIDLSHLSPEDAAAYTAQIDKLKENDLFKAYYDKVIESKTNYIVRSGSGSGGSGSFHPDTKEVFSSPYNAYTQSQELFHAYQDSLGVYSDADRSVRETEGDLVSYSIGINLGEPGVPGELWLDEIADTFLGADTMFDERVFSKAFDDAFNKAVDARIEFYKKRELEEKAPAPKGYIQPNSKVGALALKASVREMIANRQKNSALEIEELLKIRK